MAAVVVVMVSSTPCSGCGAGNGGGNGYKASGHVKASPPAVLWPVVGVYMRVLTGFIGFVGGL